LIAPHSPNPRPGAGVTSLLAALVYHMPPAKFISR
jgi:hypothetical protein